MKETAREWTRLEELRGRQQEFLEKAETARIELQSALRAFAQGAVGAEQRSNEARRRVENIEGSLEILEADIVEAERAATAAEQAEELETRVTRMLSHADEAEAARKDYDTAHVELGDLFTEYVDKTVETWEKWVAAVRAFNVDVDAVQAAGMSGPGLAKELESRGATLDSVLCENMAPGGNFAQRRVRYIPPEMGEYGQWLGEALHKSRVQYSVKALKEEREQEQNSKPPTVVVSEAVVQS